MNSSTLGSGSTAMDTRTALAGLGVEPLDPTIAAALDRDGYAVVPDVLDEPQLGAVRARLQELAAQEGEHAGIEVHQEAGTARLSDLVNKGEVFDVFYTHPIVLAAVAHVLDGDLKLSSLNSRAALPGKGHQGLHADWGPLDLSEGFQVCNSIWLLDDFTPHNGATRVVPGSHLGGVLPGQAMADPADDHPDQVQLLGPAGTVVVFNSHLWHGGTHNSTDQPRRAMHSAWCRRTMEQQLDQKAYLRRSTYDRLNSAQHYLLDVTEADIQYP
jgi:ectoine hydroxylase-related dioxygenase (phytanoyl-CoA dioxygenase family)